MAEKQKVPMVVIIGDKEINENLVAIRDRRTREQYTLPRDEFINLAKKKINEGNF
jgi:threonyl-tRNA synthetase